MMITFYQQTNTPIGFWHKWGLSSNLFFFFFFFSFFFSFFDISIGTMGEEEFESWRSWTYLKVPTT